jgi:hypothetical protein
MLGTVTLAKAIGDIAEVTLAEPTLDDIIAMEVAQTKAEGSTLAGVKALIARVCSPAMTPAMVGRMDPRDLPKFVALLGPFFAAIGGTE